jgi:predicted transcriptional regulator
MARPQKKYVNHTSVLKISSFPNETREVLDNIAANMHEDLSKILRPVIKDFIEKQPEQMKRKPLDF